MLVGRADAEPDADRDDSLALLFLCCHPALSSSSRIALTPRAVGGLTTTQITAVFLVPESTMAQRISRAKQTIKSSSAPLRMPDTTDRAERLQAVLHVLYLIFNEGYVTTDGDDLTARRCPPSRSAWPAGCIVCCPTTVKWPGCSR